MPNVLIVNGHQPYPSSPGRLNAAFAEVARDHFIARHWAVRTMAVSAGWDVEAEVQNQLWADHLLFQFPLNSMGLPWPLKRYLDEVYTAGMDGRLAAGDGRTRKDPVKQYGSGGLMGGKSYTLSVTLNAPCTAFCDPSQTLFQGRSLDELLAPIHINFAFFGLRPCSTFAAYDVKKAPNLDADFARYHRFLEDVTDTRQAQNHSP